MQTFYWYIIKHRWRDRETSVNQSSFYLSRDLRKLASMSSAKKAGHPKITVELMLLFEAGGPTLDGSSASNSTRKKIS